MAEHVAAGPRGIEGMSQLILHSLWGGRVNRPLALFLAEAVRRELGLELDVGHDDHCVVLAAEASASSIRVLPARRVPIASESRPILASDLP